MAPKAGKTKPHKAKGEKKKKEEKGSVWFQICLILNIRINFFTRFFCFIELHCYLYIYLVDIFNFIGSANSPPYLSANNQNYYIIGLQFCRPLLKLQWKHQMIPKLPSR